MKFSCKTENLKKGLGLCMHSIGKSQHLPVLQNVLLTAENGALYLASTNLEIGIQTTIHGKLEKTGSISVPAKLFTDYISNTSADTVQLSTKENVLVIESDKSQTSIKGTDASEFPLLPEIESVICFDLDSFVLKQCLQQVVFASAKDTTRPELCTVLMHIQNNELLFAATDSYRLAEKKVKLGIDTTLRVLIPQSTLAEVYRVFGEGESKITIEVNDHQVKFSHAQTFLISRVAEGQFPDYEQIIPEKNTTTAVVSVSELSKSLRAASIFCKQGINDVTLEFKKDTIILYALNDQVGESRVMVDADIDGPEVSIVFNYHYILDGLSAQQEDMVVFGIQEPSLPGVLRPVQDQKYTYVIMPIRQ